MDQLGAILAQVAQNNQQLTEGLAHQEQLRVQAARGQQEVQAPTQMVVEVADRGRGVVDVKQIGKLDILRGTREQGLTEWQAWSCVCATWFSSQFANVEDALDWAKSQVVECANAEITAKSTTGGWTDLTRINVRITGCSGVTLP